MWFIFSLIMAIAAFGLDRFLRRRENPEEMRRLSAAARFVALVLSTAALFSCLTVVPAGHVGVVDFFGRVSPTTLKAGINLVNPLARIIKMSVKTQETKAVMDVPSKEGLSVQLEVSLIYHLDPEKAAEVYRTVGPDFEHVLLEPQFRSVSRGVTAGFEAKALYTSEREVLASQILDHLKTLVGPRGVSVESTPLRRVGLPQRLSQSIEEKLEPSRKASAWSSSSPRNARKRRENASKPRASLTSKVSFPEASVNSSCDGKGSRQPSTWQHRRMRRW